jgi:hypothetical protein
VTGDWRRLAAGASTARIEAALKANAAAGPQAGQSSSTPDTFWAALLARWIGGMILESDALCVPGTDRGRVRQVTDQPLVRTGLAYTAVVLSSRRWAVCAPRAAVNHWASFSRKACRGRHTGGGCSR